MRNIHCVLLVQQHRYFHIQNRTWAQANAKYVHYNAANVKIFEENVDLGGLSFDGKSVVTLTYKNEKPVTGTYTVTKSNNVEYLTLSAEGESLKYSIVSISDNNMSLSMETPNDTYYEGGKVKTSAKSILTAALVKK